MSIPKDPVMLLSYVNTQLRDHYSTLDDMCTSLSLEKQEIISSLQGIDYVYAKDQNQFI
ncbi:MAG: DUF4250 domain-containing protein [Lachnospiraceae bacterium]|jgi:hypothetical protein|nr:DUF4250 domain-containing protein [Lachnospiraceae bacterium]